MTDYGYKPIANFILSFKMLFVFYEMKKYFVSPRNILNSTVGSYNENNCTQLN